MPHTMSESPIHGILEGVLVKPKTVNVRGNSPSLAAHLIEQCAHQTQGNILFIGANNSRSRAVFNAFSAITSSDISRILIPDLETIPYDSQSPSVAASAARLKGLHQCATLETRKVAFTSVSSLLKRVPNAGFWADSPVRITKGDELEVDDVLSRLASLGYSQKGDRVEEQGDVFWQSNLIEIFPVGFSEPVRARVESGICKALQTFDIESLQRSESLDDAVILPTREVPLDRDSIRQYFQKNFREAFSQTVGSKIYEGVMRGDIPSGVEYLSPLFCSDMRLSSIPELLEDYVIVVDNGCLFDLELETISGRFQELSKLPDETILPPRLNWLQRSELNEIFEGATSFNIGEEGLDLGIENNQIPSISSASEATKLLKELASGPDKVVFFIASGDRFDQLSAIMEFAGLKADVHGSYKSACGSDSSISVVRKSVAQGFHDKNSDVLAVSEKEFFGKEIVVRKNSGDQKSLESDFTSFTPMAGDPLVHLQYGIGRFEGIRHLSLGPSKKDYLILCFKNDAKYFVPTEDLGQIYRYSGLEYDSAVLSDMSTKSWSKTLDKAVQGIEKVANSLYISQKTKEVTQKGHSIKVSAVGYKKFCNDFPFEETRDQLVVINEVLDDLKSSKPMDRLVVGDVGFGKTEVALRTAFVTAKSGYQVAIMAPTSLLASQHHKTFSERLSGYSVPAYLFAGTTEDSAEIVEKINSGEPGVYIGTSKLIQKSVRFGNLGLLVVDEEHRFGVTQKEIIRSFENKVNMLSMTATPIPRTLGLSLRGVRELSTLSTPPAKRLSIRTQSGVSDRSVYSEAIRRETYRKGQVFVVHNRVKGIFEFAHKISAWFPLLSVGVAHGQMGGLELELVMKDFVNQKFDILVCTTIIETGIDVPNANTIIIDGADSFGLAQLHQLRGRVGRSDHQAYAYLLHDGDISNTAKERLKAMERESGLGRGMNLSKLDMEIRGAGELLGEDQTGQIKKIGFSLYMSLLDQAMRQLNELGHIEKDILSASQFKMDIGIDCSIRSEYIESDDVRIEYYRRISTSKRRDQLLRIQHEMTERFGSFSLEEENLFRFHQRRCDLQDLGVQKLFIGAGEMVVIGTPSRSFCEKLFAIEASGWLDSEASSGGKLTSVVPKDITESRRFELVDSIVDKLG